MLMRRNASLMSDRLTNDKKFRNLVVNLKTLSTYWWMECFKKSKLLISYLNSWKFSWSRDSFTANFVRGHFLLFTLRFVLVRSEWAADWGREGGVTDRRREGDRRYFLALLQSRTHPDRDSLRGFLRRTEITEINTFVVFSWCSGGKEIRNKK